MTIPYTEDTQYTMHYAYQSESDPERFMFIYDNGEDAMIVMATAFQAYATEVGEDSGLWLDTTSGDDMQEIETNQVPLSVQHWAQMAANKEELRISNA